MKDEIIKSINEMSGNYSGYEIFTDWIKASAISIDNSTDIFHGKIWKKREEEYAEICKKHGPDKMKRFSDMLGMLAISLENNMEDVLGKIYMEAGLGSKKIGQFFTPFHLSELTARMGMNLEEIKNNKDPILINEPSTGGGGMIIGVAKVLKNSGIDYQRRMRVVAQDLDWKGVYMTYVQLSLLGIKAIVVQGNTLEIKNIRQVPKERKMYTPAEKGVLI